MSIRICDPDPHIRHSDCAQRVCGGYGQVDKPHGAIAKTILFLVLRARHLRLLGLLFQGLQIGDASKVAPIDKSSLILTALLP